MSDRQRATDRIKELLAAGDEISGSSQIAARLKSATTAQLRNIATARTIADIKVILFASTNRPRRRL